MKNCCKVQKGFYLSEIFKCYVTFRKHLTLKIHEKSINQKWNKTIPFILPLFYRALSQIHVHFISIIIILMYSISFLHECTWCVLFLNIDYFYVTALKVIHQIKKIRIASFSSFHFSFSFLLFILNVFSFVQTLAIKYSLHKHQQKLFKVFDIIFCIILSKHILFGSAYNERDIKCFKDIFSFTIYS